MNFLLDNLSLVFNKLSLAKMVMKSSISSSIIGRMVRIFTLSKRQTWFGCQPKNLSRVLLHNLLRSCEDWFKLQIGRGSHLVN